MVKQVVARWDGVAQRVAVLEVDPDYLPEDGPRMITPRAAGVIRVVKDWPRVYPTALPGVLEDARALAFKLNRRTDEAGPWDFTVDVDEYFTVRAYSGDMEIRGRLDVDYQTEDGRMGTSASVAVLDCQEQLEDGTWVPCWCPESLISELEDLANERTREWLPMFADRRVGRITPDYG